VTAKNHISLSVSHTFRASAERVYDAFLDPAKAAKFMFVTPTGKNVRCEIDARVGGKFVITDRRDGEDVAHEGEFLELDRPRRLVFTVCVPKYSADIGHVVVEITPKTAGCDVTLTETMSAQWEEHRKNIEAGWKGILVGLHTLLEKIGNPAA